MLLQKFFEQFNQAADSGDASEEFKVLKNEYKNLFGDKFEAFMHIMFNHTSANLHDYLWADHADRFNSMSKIDPALKDNAIQALVYEWGSDEQIAAQNKAFELPISLGIFSESEAEACCNKSTTEEMMGWIESRCSNFLKDNPQ